MKLATFAREGRRGIGVVEDDAIVDLATAAPGLPTNMLELLEAGPDALAAAGEAARRARSRIPLADVTLEAPIRRPPKILAVGLNYADHIRETGAARPEFPVIFNKQSTAVVGPGRAILIPPESTSVDYEGELAMVVGIRCRRVPRSRAREVVAGLTICNDVSVRDWQKRTPTMTMGKSWDTHCPLGPYIVTLDEIPDPQSLTLVTRVNGEVRQRASTAEMVFACWDLIAHISTAFTLEPGDIISTGTPAGVGMAMKPQRWLRAGDVVSIEIDGLGILSNPVAAESVVSATPG
jgi:2-keto-4-pentenoate hydratase/2-oxohepta-3-ene-1,7-dioic acid hydratase in catechol pathway